MSLTFSLKGKGRLEAISASPDQSHAAVGGRDVFQIIKLGTAGLEESTNLRSRNGNLGLVPKDIQWHRHHAHLLGTSAPNGNVMIWDLSQSGKKRHLHCYRHQRVVNRICWSQHQSDTLFAASQDKTVKCWDMRMDGGCAATYRHTASVRDVQHSPFMHFAFASVGEDGSLHLWDARQPAAPLVKFTAHLEPCLALDWHPQRRLRLMSGSRDRTVKVWDLQRGGAKPAFVVQIHTIASVGRIKWRPDVAAQLASSANMMDNSVHIWDIHRPNMPLATVRGHTDVASGFVWMRTPRPQDKQEAAAAVRAAAAADVVATAAAAEDSADAARQAEEASGGSGVDSAPGGHSVHQHILSCGYDSTVRLHAVALSDHFRARACTVALAVSPHNAVTSVSDLVDRSVHSLRLGAMSEARTTPAFALPPEWVGRIVDASSPLVFREPRRPAARLRESVPAARPYDVPQLQQAPPGERAAAAAAAATTALRGSMLESARVWGFDARIFGYFAHRYRLSGASASVLCAHNAQVALAMEQHQVAKTWMMLQLMLLSVEKPAQRTASTTEEEARRSAQSLSLAVQLPQTAAQAEATQAATAAAAAAEEELSAAAAAGSDISTGTTSLMELLDAANPAASEAFGATPFSATAADAAAAAAAAAALPDAESSAQQAQPAAGSSSLSAAVAASSSSVAAAAAAARQSRYRASRRKVGGGGAAAAAMLTPEFVTAMSAAPSGSDDGVGLAWLLKQTLLPLLKFCTDQGDVQTCVAVSVVISSAPGFDQIFATAQMKKWQTIYIGECWCAPLWPLVPRI
jgi:WD40 repeat protein